jgi:hypothetical protein
MELAGREAGSLGLTGQAVMALAEKLILLALGILKNYVASVKAPEDWHARVGT